MQLLRLCFVLHLSKALNVHYTATAAIRQATVVLFEKLALKTSMCVSQSVHLSIYDQSFFLLQSVQKHTMFSFTHSRLLNDGTTTRYIYIYIHIK